MFGNTPHAPGIYIVTLNNEDPISVNADRPAIASRCIEVNKYHCKYGKADNLNRRHRDYAKTFGVNNVNFHVMALMGDPGRIETALHNALASYRVRGTTGVLNEWLIGIEKSQLEEVIKNMIHNHAGNGTNSVDQIDESIPKRTIVCRSAQTSVDLSHTCDRIVAALTYLKEQGMTTEQLRDIHHFSRRTETYSSALRYFGTYRELKGKNIAFGLRLEYLASEHRKRLAGFNLLIQEALSSWPVA